MFSVAFRLGFLLLVGGLVNVLIGCRWKFQCRAPYTWLYKLRERVTRREIRRGYDYYMLDLFDTQSEDIARIHERGGKVVCYFSGGTLEEWRPDAGLFPDSVVGNPMEGWQGEYWLDIRSLAVRSVMVQRMELAVRKGCDAVEADNLDGWMHNTGFPLTSADAVDYFTWLAQEAHSRGLQIALKNNGELVSALLSVLDMAIVEECFVNEECDWYVPVVQSGKPVFVVEYDLPRREFCCPARQYGFSAARACLALDGCWKPCF